MQHPLALRFPSRVAVVAALLVACGGDDGTAPDATIASIDITGAPASPVTVGSYVKLSAVVRNAGGRPLTGHTVTWRTGDPLIAYVDQTGLVLTLDGGSAMITATVEGKTARTTISVTPLGVSRVSVLPATPKLYVNNALQLHADVKDSKGRSLTGHAVQWFSSDVAKATVDDNGLVRALSTGGVTITATSDGVVGSTVVTVIPTAYADWSGAADWPTVQGNASHTGYVPVTIDPNALNLRWSADFAPDFALVSINPVTASDGKIFVTSNDGLLRVLDERTGALKWAYRFSPVDNVNAPAFGDGGVFVQTGGQQNSYLWGFDANTGAIRFRTPYGNQWQTYLAPVVVGQSVFFGGGQYGGMYALSTSSGDRQWFESLDMNDRFTPAVRDGLAYAYTGIQRARLSVVDAASGAIAYEIPDPNFTLPDYQRESAPSLGALDDAFVTQNGRLIAFDLANRRVKWERAGQFRGSVAIANGVVYASDGMQFWALQESDGAPLWSLADPHYENLGTPVVTNNVIFVPSSERVSAIDLRTHQRLWEISGIGSLTLTRDGLLLVPQHTGELLAFDLRQ